MRRYNLWGQWVLPKSSVSVLSSFWKPIFCPKGYCPLGSLYLYKACSSISCAPPQCLHSKRKTLNQKPWRKQTKSYWNCKGLNGKEKRWWKVWIEEVYGVQGLEESLEQRVQPRSSKEERENLAESFHPSHCRAPQDWPDDQGWPSSPELYLSPWFIRQQLISLYLKCSPCKAFILLTRLCLRNIFSYIQWYSNKMIQWYNNKMIQCNRSNLAKSFNQTHLLCIQPVQQCR